MLKVYNTRLMYSPYLGCVTVLWF